LVEPDEIVYRALPTALFVNPLAAAIAFTVCVVETMSGVV
jgi:hypothetical protein